MQKVFHSVRLASVVLIKLTHLLLTCFDDYPFSVWRVYMCHSQSLLGVKHKNSSDAQ